MISTIITLAIILCSAICLVWSYFLRKMRKTRVRAIGTIISLVLAIVGTAVLRGTLLNDAKIEAELLPWLTAQLPGVPLAELLATSPTLADVALGCAYAIAAPLVFFLIFFIAYVLSFIVYLFVVLVRGSAMKEADTATTYVGPKALAWAAAQVVIVTVVCLVPLSTYSEIAPIIADAAVKAEVVDDGTIDPIMEQYVDPINKNVFVSVFRVMGGEAATDALTSFHVGAEKTVLKNELGAVADLGCNVLQLTKKEFAAYGEAEAALIVAVADSFSDSEMLPAIAGELIYGATDAWLKGEPFVGIYPEAIYFDQTGMFDSMIDQVLNILHKDAMEPDALCADIKTVANMVATLIRGEIFSSLGNQEDLIEIFTKEGLVNALIRDLGSNDSMKVLIGEITNIGVRAIGSTLGIKENADVAYNEMLDSIAAELNAVKNMSSADQVATMTTTLSKAFNDAGMVVDKQVLDFYSGTMIDSLLEESGDSEITAESVKGFFALYAWSVSEYAQEIDQVGLANKNNTQALDASDPAEAILQALLVGTVYEGKSIEELKASGPAVLARVTVKLSKIEVSDSSASVAEQAKAIVEKEYTELLKDESKKELLQIMVSVEVKKPVPATSVTNTASLQAAETMKETTVLVTLDKLLVDTSKGAEKLNAENVEKEAAAIEAIFSTASTLLKETSSENLDIAKVAGSVGAILDNLGSTASFGQEQTGQLFTAVLQSSTVRDAAGLDISTATQLGEKGSSGENVNYEQTFQTVADTVTIIGGMGDGTLSEEDLEKMIRNINPQTAGMIEVYVTADRLIDDYDVPEKEALIAAPLLSNIFKFMGNSKMDDAQYAAEAKAINDIMNVIMAASEGGDKDRVFGDSENSVLGKTAYETVELFMSSHAIAYSLRETDFEPDPFGLSETMHESEEESEMQELLQAIHDYYNVPENRTEENKETLVLLGMLFGFTAEEINDLLVD